ncbi:SMR family transporter [Pendulispora rubella]|uniref:SMR family transporter n=1 Tax=Pendulispora rubella TaxID=2741070 RepID=A0ABZ2L083_9BACT
MTGYVYLGLAIACEVVATSALKASGEFKQVGPSLLVLFGYGGAFYFLSKTLQSIPVGVAYAIWSGVGITLVTLIAAMLYRQKPDLPAIMGMLLIVAGVLVIQLFSRNAGH